jgi:hypothetical protein
MPHGIKRKMAIARASVRKEISRQAGHSRLASAMATEGFNGGYLKALDDVLLALNGNEPQTNGWWNDGK